MGLCWAVCGWSPLGVRLMGVLSSPLSLAEHYPLPTSLETQGLAVGSLWQVDPKGRDGGGMDSTPGVAAAASSHPRSRWAPALPQALIRELSGPGGGLPHDGE